jgi:hypothetical protein
VASERQEDCPGNPSKPLCRGTTPARVQQHLHCPALLPDVTAARAAAPAAIIIAGRAGRCSL